MSQMSLIYAYLAFLSALSLVNIAIVIAVVRKSRRTEATYRGLHLVLGRHPWVAEGLRDLPEPGND